MKRIAVVLLVVSLLAAGALHASPKKEPRLAVDGKVPKALSLGAADVRKLPRTKQALDGKDEYEGVLLSDLLAAAGLPMGQHRRGHYPIEYVLVEAADGYRAVFSLAEIDPGMGGGKALLADRKGGAPLPATHGPWQIVVPGDKMRSRWVRQVVKLTVGVAGPEQRELHRH